MILFMQVKNAQFGADSRMEVEADISLSKERDRFPELEEADKQVQLFIHDHKKQGAMKK